MQTCHQACSSSYSPWRMCWYSKGGLLSIQNQPKKSSKTCRQEMVLCTNSPIGSCLVIQITSPSDLVFPFFWFLFFSLPVLYPCQWKIKRGQSHVKTNISSHESWRRYSQKIPTNKLPQYPREKKKVDWRFRCQWNKMKLSLQIDDCMDWILVRNALCQICFTTWSSFVRIS